MDIMPGWEYIGKEERQYCDQVFSNSGYYVNTALIRSQVDVILVEKV